MYACAGIDQNAFLIGFEILHGLDEKMYYPVA